MKEQVKLKMRNQNHSSLYYTWFENLKKELLTAHEILENSLLGRAAFIQNPANCEVMPHQFNYEEECIMSVLVGFLL